jgi:hypothetical protein
VCAWIVFSVALALTVAGAACVYRCAGAPTKACAAGEPLFVYIDAGPQ